MAITYLASPYTHQNPTVCDARYHAATYVAAQLILQNKVVFSPITMTHPLDRLMIGGTGTLGSAYWIEFDREFMAACNLLAVLCLPGWENSSGIKREISFFKNRGTRPELLNPATFGITPDAELYSAAWKI